MTGNKKTSEPVVTDWSGLDKVKMETSYEVLEEGLKEVDDRAEAIVKLLGLEEMVLPRVAYARGMYARDVYGFLSRRLRK